MLQKNCSTQFLQERGIFRTMCMIQLYRLQSQNTVFHCNKMKRNTCPWTLLSSIYEVGKAREEVCQEELGVCPCTHTHIHVCRAGVSQELLTTTTVVGWHNPPWGNMGLITVRIWSPTWPWQRFSVHRQCQMSM